MIQNVKIVVADADKLVRDFTVDVLEFCVNREVMAYDNGRDAWEYIQQPDSAHIVIADAGAPLLNGFDLLRNVKAAFPEKICILASHRYADEKTAQALGADAFLAKPFYIDEIFDLVQQFVVAG